MNYPYLGNNYTNVIALARVSAQFSPLTPPDTWNGWFLWAFVGLKWKKERHPASLSSLSVFPYLYCGA